MGEAKRTPANLEIIGDDELVPDVPCIIIGAGEIGTESFKQICDVESTLNIETDKWSITDVDRANAAFIVRAWNSHDEMLDALKQCAEYLGSLPPGTIREPLYLAYSAACDAIARATGDS